MRATHFLLSFSILAIGSLVLSEAVSTPVEIDPLSMAPLPFSEEKAAESRAAFSDPLLYKDADCFLKPDDIAATEIPFDRLNSKLQKVCARRDRELVYVRSQKVIVACLGNVAQFAMKVSIGSNGLGKTAEGNRKSPSGTYWVGYPRRSEDGFGIFIPVGYPNMTEIGLGYTGSAIGIHGPMRFLTCLPSKSLESDWTAGCFAVARDTQIIALSEWILAHWPVRLSVRHD